MADDYPYMVSNNKIKPILDAILLAAKPAKFSHEFLKNLGFSSSNDRAFISLFRRLGFMNENGLPTEFYDDLKDKSRREYILGERIKDLYSDLFSLNTTIHSASDDDVKGAISRVTGKDAKTVGRYLATFKALCVLAKFDNSTASKPSKTPEAAQKPTKENSSDDGNQGTASTSIKHTQFHYNIQIHLPATTDVSVYNAIFKSLKDTLMV